MANFLLALAFIPIASAPYNLSNVDGAAVPYVVQYMQCFIPASDIAKQVLAGATDVALLPARCRAVRPQIEAQAIQAFTHPVVQTGYLGNVGLLAR